MKRFFSFYFSPIGKNLSVEVMQTWSLVSICVLLGVVVRWGVSLNSYSGRKCVCVELNVTMRHHSENYNSPICYITAYFSVTSLDFFVNYRQEVALHFRLASTHWLEKSCVSFIVCVLLCCHPLM